MILSRSHKHCFVSSTSYIKVSKRGYKKKNPHRIPAQLGWRLGALRNVQLPAAAAHLGQILWKAKSRVYYLRNWWAESKSKDNNIPREAYVHSSGDAVWRLEGGEVHDDLLELTVSRTFWNGQVEYRSLAKYTVNIYIYTQINIY